MLLDSKSVRHSGNAAPQADNITSVIDVDEKSWMKLSRSCEEVVNEASACGEATKGGRARSSSAHPIRVLQRHASQRSAGDVSHGAFTSTRRGRWICFECGFSNDVLLPYCEACEACKPVEGLIGGGTVSRFSETTEDEFPSVGAAVKERGRAGSAPPKLSQSSKSGVEFRRLPPPERQSQSKRKKKRLLANSKAIATSEGISSEKQAADGSDEDFEDCASASYDLLDEALGQGSGHSDENAPSYDALLETLRAQLRQHRVGLTDQQGVAKVTDGLAASEQAEMLRLLEARRLAEAAAQGKKRNKSLEKKRALRDKKLDREYIKNEIKNAYTAEMNQSVRFYNSVAIKVTKGEKSVDAKTIATVTAAQEGRMAEKLTKEDRMELRRCA